MRKEFSEHNIPTLLVIFGATGDLARRKLFPALFDLFRRDYLPDKFQILGFAHTDCDNKSFRNHVRELLLQKYSNETEKIETFVSFLDYHRGSFDEPSSYRELADKIIDIDRRISQCTNKLFYLSVSPKFYEVLLRNLAHSGLTVPCSDASGWTRVLIEKPFGKDLQTARELDVLLGKLFREEQIFRIDHYLAKETIQNILTFRFANSIFEPIWNNRYVERVEIDLWEDIDVGTRGAFYDGIGALRDVGQNHVLQMLALVAMDNPQTMDSRAIRAKRAEILRSLIVPTPEKVFRAGYRGYRDTPGVAADSSTETFFRLQTELNTKKWRGVPFVMTAGKALPEKKTSVRVIFKPAEHCLCPSSGTRLEGVRNVLTFRIQPEEGITMDFLAKKPGLSNEVVCRELSFDYRADATEVQPDAYEKVLFDCIRGDQTLFASTEEVRATWEFITPIIQRWHRGEGELHCYDKGEFPDISNQESCC